MTTAARESSPSLSRNGIPTLAHGDRLTRSEFERRYAAMPGKTKAELLEGVVYMSPAVRFVQHGEPHALLMAWLTYYVAKTPGLRLADNATVRFTEDNEPQPDALLILPQHMGGRATIDSDGYVSGPPALVCEIAASSADIDLHAKKDIYRQHGVSEYLVWRTGDAAIDWFTLEASDYRPILPESDSILRSPTFPGLCLQPATILAGDFQGLFNLLDQTTGTPGHAAWRKQLSSNMPPR